MYKNTSNQNEFYNSQVVKMSEERERSVQSLAIVVQPSDSHSKKHNSYVPGQKSGKWSQQEHLKYVVFIDYNKQKMRSKDKRRSNKFYEEMSRFISTRNALQCRSHHQKLEEKYNQINKIINLYKGAFNKTLYRQMMDNLDAISHEKKTLSQKSRTHSNIMVDACVQTEIQDLRYQFIQMEPNIIMIQGRGQVSSQQFFPPPPYYYPNVYQNIEFPTNSMIPPPYPQSLYGWWGGVTQNRL